MTHPLTTYREKHCLTQQEFGSRIGATKGMVSKWEAGRSLPRAHFLRKIEDVSGGEITIGALVQSFSHIQTNVPEAAE